MDQRVGLELISTAFEGVGGRGCAHNNYHMGGASELL